MIVARVHAVAGRKSYGRPQFDFRIVVEERQSPRHHAGDGEVFAAEFDLASYDRAVAAEAALPQTVTEQYDAMPPELIFFRSEESPERRRDFKRVEKVARDVCALHTRRLTLGRGKIEVAIVKSGQPLECAILIAPFAVIGHRVAVSGRSPGSRCPEEDQTFG